MTDHQYLLADAESREDAVIVGGHIPADLQEAYLNNIRLAIANVDTDFSELAVHQVRARWDLYLIASYLYYKSDYSILLDAQFDRLCKQLNGLTDEYVEKYLWTFGQFDRSALSAGSGYHITKLTPMVFLAQEKLFNATQGKPVELKPAQLTMKPEFVFKSPDLAHQIKRQLAKKMNTNLATKDDKK